MMRKFLALVAAGSLLSFGAMVEAGAAEFPDFVEMESGPEGVVVDNVGNVYVSVGVPGPTWNVEIRRFSPTGEPETIAEIAVGPGETPAGMAISPNGKRLYVGVIFNGVYEVDLAGNYHLLPGTEAIVLPNSLAFDDDLNLYITETFSFDVVDGLSFYPACDLGFAPFTGYFGRGGIWVVPAGGSAELLMRHDLLTGLCYPNPIPYPVGANGLAYDDGELVVANTEKALLLEIEVQPDGSLGEPSVIAHVEGMGPVGPWLLDGLALDVHGDVFVAVVTGPAVVKVARDGSSTDVLGTAEDGLDFPASLAFGTGKGERKNIFVTNLALGDSEDLGLAGPGVAKIAAGTPGMPLP